ncbi:MAG: putative transposase [Gammaproteobacteria bacterium]|jgi:putative transposase
MPNYIRNRIKGGCYFFTVNLLERHQNHLLIEQIDLLRNVVRQVKHKYPFHIDGWVVLPEHMHFMFTLPQGDDDYATKIRPIKTLFSKNLPKTERRSTVRQKRGERGIWQRRFWEHSIRDESDYKAHMDYLHNNPVKHSHVEQVKDWSYSTFHHLIKCQVYPENWGGNIVEFEAGERF